MNYQQSNNRPSSYHQERSRSEEEPLNTDEIKLANPKPELFDSVANRVAEKVSKPLDKNGRLDDKKNKPTQIRKFYDEIVMWDQRVRQNKDGYNQFLPLIKMINAKVAYAEGRELVDKNFTKLMRCCLDQVKENEPQTLHHCKLFLEAFMGFFKLHRPK